MRASRAKENGFSLAPAQQGKGYGTEALRALLGYVFGTLGLHHVTAVTDARNPPAAALLERVGMRREAHFHENVFFKGAWEASFSSRSRCGTGRSPGDGSPGSSFGCRLLDPPARCCSGA
jgi:RimJ/RimL family protein N-acetyltransferase